MHTTAMSNGKLFFDTYVAPLGSVSVVDIGSQDVNGSLREVCPASARYIGVDFERAKGVDIVLTDPYSLPFESDSIDVIVSSSCFEHSEMFWLVFIEILRVLRPGGLFYLNVPSNGAFHRYPVDCWRFYPDSGKALVAWARRSGFGIALLESFISHQTREFWNDFVAVFLKDEQRIESHPRRMLPLHPSFENGWIHGGAEVINQADMSEDFRRSQQLWLILQRELARSQQLVAGLAEISQQTEPLERALTQARFDAESARRGLNALRTRLASLEAIAKEGAVPRAESGSLPTDIDESTLRTFGNAPTVTVHRVPRTDTARPFLVLVRAGADPMVQSHWKLDAPDRRFDLLASFYAPPQPDCWLLRNADYVVSGGLSKFHAAKLLLSDRLIERYAGFLFLDDDVETHFDPGVFADFAHGQAFGLAQASLTADSFHSHATTLHHPSCAWRETNFVEVMAPYFSREVLRSAVTEFDRTISSWGLDVLWGIRHAASRIAVIDLFTMRHRHPVDTRDGPFYRYLRGIGIDPQRELTQVMDELQIGQFEIATTKVTFLPAGIRRPSPAPGG